MKEAIIQYSSYLRTAVRNLNQPFRQGPAGIIAGLVYRESEMADFFHQTGEKWEILQTLLSAVPHPMWPGIHPEILKQIVINRKSDGTFWESRLNALPPKGPSNPLVVHTEPNLPGGFSEQVDFITSLLPKGSLSLIFLTKGKDTVWKHIPGVKAFATDPHQMSIPFLTGKHTPGFNMLLLTSTPSETTPALWKAGFAKKLGANLKDPLAGMNLHQVGHCLCLPSCWEYIDRTYSLVTPNALLDLTIERNKALLTWFEEYAGNLHYPPDSTSYLYEVKVVERALFVAHNHPQAKRQKPTSNPVEYWFRGIHLDTLTEEMACNQQDVYTGLALMDEYWLNQHHTPPTDPILNSAVHSTDIGTHPSEEVIVDALALSRVNQLPSHMSYWRKYTQTVFSLWRNFDPNFMNSN